MLPVEILGSVYERFLGKTVRLTAGGQAQVEEKPEIRKAGGVYYTPQYIVDYIVRETVGWTPEEPKEPVTVLDPACGSGSFLVGAYTFLLDRRLAWLADGANVKASLRRGLIYGTGGQAPGFRLSIAEKQRILTESVFGVDIDPIAVEVAKFSLYLKLLEHETEETRERLFRHTDMKMLPNLDANIRCGNALIENDYYEGKNMARLDEAELRRVNAMDWRTAFPQAHQAGGFGCVIGNPPWGQKAVKFRQDEKVYYHAKGPARNKYSKCC
jgi:predicted RNA methylase